MTRGNPRFGGREYTGMASSISRRINTCDDLPMTYKAHDTQAGIDVSSWVLGVTISLIHESEATVDTWREKVLEILPDKFPSRERHLVRTSEKSLLTESGPWYQVIWIEFQLLPTEN